MRSAFFLKPQVSGALALGNQRAWGPMPPTADPLTRAGRNRGAAVYTGAKGTTGPVYLLVSLDVAGKAQACILLVKSIYFL